MAPAAVNNLDPLNVGRSGARKGPKLLYWPSSFPPHSGQVPPPTDENIAAKKPHAGHFAFAITVTSGPPFAATSGPPQPGHRGVLAPHETSVPTVVLHVGQWCPMKMCDSISIQSS